MIAVGLTGGIGAGKSYIAQLFKNLGIAVFDADTEAKWLMLQPTLKHDIIKLFGGQAYYNNQLNRAYIASLVFNNPQTLQQLNQIVHPAVQQHFSQWLLQQTGVYALKEAAILIESGSYKTCSEVILVTAPEHLRIKRVMLRDKLTEPQVRHRISNQWTDEQKQPFASFTIVNDGISDAQGQVFLVHQKIVTKYKIVL
jgi:dephospho-CoA kinase